MWCDYVRAGSCCDCAGLCLPAVISKRSWPLIVLHIFIYCLNPRRVASNNKVCCNFWMSMCVIYLMRILYRFLRIYVILVLPRMKKAVDPLARYGDILGYHSVCIMSCTTRYNNATAWYINIYNMPWSAGIVLGCVRREGRGGINPLVWWRSTPIVGG